MKLLKDPRKILVIKPSALGDIIHTLPFLNAMQDRFPESNIHWVAARGLHGILDGHPMIQRLWIIDKDRWKNPRNMKDTLYSMVKLGADLKKEQFEVVVDLQGLLRSGIICVLTGSACRIGFSEAREGSTLFYTHRVRGGTDVHAVDRYLEQAAFLGCDVTAPRFPFPELPKDFPLLKILPDKYVVIAPSAGGPLKRWPAERFGELASRLPWKSVVVASAADAGLAETVVRFSKGNAISVAGRTTLKELASLIGTARFLVSPDTGPMHIAAALNVPVFALFGPTNPARTGPYGQLHRVIRAEAECAPCYRRKKCADWSCMTGITVDQVFERIMSGCNQW